MFWGTHKYPSINFLKKKWVLVFTILICRHVMYLYLQWGRKQVHNILDES